MVCTATDAVEVTDREKPVFTGGCPEPVVADAVIDTRAGLVTYELLQVSDNVGLTAGVWSADCRLRSGSGSFAVGDTTVVCDVSPSANIKVDAIRVCVLAVLAVLRCQAGRDKSSACRGVSQLLLWKIREKGSDHTGAPTRSVGVRVTHHLAVGRARTPAANESYSRGRPGSAAPVSSDNRSPQRGTAKKISLACVALTRRRDSSSSDWEIVY